MYGQTSLLVGTARNGDPELDGRVELIILDDEGLEVACVTLDPEALPDIVSAILSNGGFDELGRDTAVKMREGKTSYDYGD